MKPPEQVIADRLILDEPTIVCDADGCRIAATNIVRALNEAGYVIAPATFVNTDPPPPAIVERNNPDAL